MTTGTFGARRWIAGWVVVASSAMLVVGCGGGGGGSAPPATTLSVSASASSATAGGSPVSLIAVTDSGATVQWALAGPGSLSATAGNAISYTPPSPDDLEAPGSATVTARVGALSQVVAVALTTSPGHTWSITTYSKSDFAAAIHANGRYVVGGGGGNMLTSADGLHWTGHYLGYSGQPRTLTWGASGGYVAAGFGGLIAQSTDGNTWTLATPFPDGAPTPDFIGAAFGAERYVLAGRGNRSGIYTSTDALHWTLADTGSSTDFVSVAYGAGRFVAAMATVRQGLMYSDDGLTWTDSNCSCSAAQVAWGNGMFVALPGTGTVSTSTDGKVWTAVAGVSVRGTLSFANGKFFAIDLREIRESADGVHWTLLPDNVPGNVGTPLAAMAGGPDGFLLVGYTNSVFRSTDLVAWTPISSDPIEDFMDVAYLNGVYVASTQFRGVFRSVDAVHWTPASTSLPYLLNSVTQADGRFIAVGDDTISTSTDGDIWVTTHLSLQPLAKTAAVAYGGGRYVAVGGPRMILTSTDAVTWEVVTTYPPDPIPLGFVGVAYGNGRFVAVGVDGATTSTDGRTWTPADNASALGTLLGVTYGSSGGFVAFGFSGAIWKSADGRVWTRATTPSTASLSDVAYANSEYVVVGAEATVLTSSDGLHWRKRNPGTGEYYLNGVAAGDGRFVVVGSRGAAIASDH